MYPAWLQRHCLGYMGFVHCGSAFQEKRWGSSIVPQKGSATIRIVSGLCLPSLLFRHGKLHITLGAIPHSRHHRYCCQTPFLRVHVPIWLREDMQLWEGYNLIHSKRLKVQFTCAIILTFLVHSNLFWGKTYNCMRDTIPYTLKGSRCNSHVQ